MVILAQEEARTLKHNYIGTEHILLALLREEEGLAARVLKSLDVTVELVRARVLRVVRSGEEVTSGQIPFTPRAQKVREFAQREAWSLEHEYIGPEHILLGLVRENEGVAARILLDFDADSEKIRDEVIRTLPSPSGRQGSGSGAQGEGTASPADTDSEHRLRALGRAHAIRDMRAKLKRSLKSGAADPVEIFLHPPAGLETAKVRDLLLAVPRWGRIKANRALATSGIPTTKTIAGLSERQRDELVALLRGPRERPPTGGEHATRSPTHQGAPDLWKR